MSSLRASSKGNILALNKLNALQASRGEQDNIIHSRVDRKAKNAARMAAKRAEGKVIDQEVLLSKEGIEETIRQNFQAAFPDRKQAKHLDKFFRFVHTVIFEHHCKQEVDAEFVEIKGSVLGAHVAKDGDFTYVVVRDYLEDWGIIEVSQQWQKATETELGHCKSYRLGASFDGATLCFTHVAKSKKQAVENQELREKLSKLKLKGYDPLVVVEAAPHIQWLKANLNRLSIDQNAAFTRIDELVTEAYPLRPKRVKKGNYYVMQTNRVCTPEIGQLYKETVLLLNRQQQLGQAEGKLSVTNGRFNTAFTRLFTCGRDYVLVDGKPLKLVSLDLAASQVYLLLNKLKQTNAGKCNPEAIERFSELLNTGNFYEQILAEVQAVTGITTADSEAKVEFFRNVIYSKKHRNTTYRKAFNQTYPAFNDALMEVVTLADGKGYRNLAIELQREESELFLQQILPQLYQKLGDGVFLTTVHDSFYCQPEHAATVAQIMREVLLAHTGCEPTIKLNGAVRSTPLTKSLAAQAIQFMETLASTPDVIFRGRVATPRGRATVYHSYDELPDKWKALVPRPQPANPLQGLSTYRKELQAKAAARVSLYSDSDPF